MRSFEAFSRFVPFSTFALLLAVGAGAGCKGETEDEGADEAASEESGTEDTETDTGEESDTGEPPEMGPCFDGLERWEWDASADHIGYDLPATDFTVETLRGPKTFSEIWNGCDNHVFVMYSANWWSTPIEPLIDDAAENTHFWFVVPSDSADFDNDMRAALVGQIAQRVEGHLESLGPEVQAAKTDTFHYVIDSGLDIPAVQGILATNPNEEHFTIGRHQKIWEGHNVAVAASGSWIPLLEQTRWWSRYINYWYGLEAELAEEAESPDVLVHRVADAVEIKGGEPYTWTLPDAATMAEYDRLEVDMFIDCPGVGHPYVATCGEWDTVGSIFLCEDAECEGDRRRVIKWITPYSAPGRWVIDITPELLELAAGGELTFISAHGDNNVGQYTYRYTVDFRFSKAEDGLRPIGKAELIPRGGYGWNENYHANWPEGFSFTAPEGTQRTELYARISGHGAVEGSQCAEFCSFTHEFSVNGTPFAHQYVQENVDRCAMLTDEGVTPNQGGTWFYDRSSWCPGWVIEEWREDLSAAVEVGAENSVAYDSWWGINNPTPPPGGNMDARVEVVFYGE